MEYQEIALILSASGWVFGAYTSFRNSKSDASEDAKTIAKILTKLDVVNGSLVEIKSRLDVSDRDNRSILERIAVVERDVKSAHNRIDSLENKEK